MVASPNDVASERGAVEDVLRKLNLTVGRLTNVRLECVKWETQTAPDFGIDAQDVVNRQLPGDIDFFVGILWGRFGTPTRRYTSGTEEEFELALERRRSGKDVGMLMYFKDAPLKPSEIVPEQVKRILAFKARVAAAGAYYWTFTDHFPELLEMHLATHLITRFEKSQQLVTMGTDDDAYVTATQLVGDLPHAAIASFRQVAVALGDVGDGVGMLMQRIASHTRDLQRPESQRNRPRIDGIMNDVASDILEFTALVERAMPTLADGLEGGVRAFLDTIGAIPIPVDSVEWRSLATQVNGLRDRMAAMSEPMRHVQHAAQAMPQYTPIVGRANRRMIAVFDRFISESAAASSLLHEMSAAMVTAAQSEAG